MDEHKHIYYIVGEGVDDVGIYCGISVYGHGGKAEQCTAYLTIPEAQAMLNEYQTLKDTAEALNTFIADLQDANDGPNEMGGPFVQLSLVADILEGK